jgi:hypothetical protein
LPGSPATHLPPKGARTPDAGPAAQKPARTSPARPHQGPRQGREGAPDRKHPPTGPARRHIHRRETGSVRQTYHQNTQTDGRRPSHARHRSRPGASRAPRHSKALAVTPPRVVEQQRSLYGGSLNVLTRRVRRPDKASHYKPATLRGGDSSQTSHLAYGGCHDRGEFGRPVRTQPGRRKSVSRHCLRAALVKP